MNSTNPFGRNEAEITIENTIKRGCKTEGGFGKSAKKFRRPEDGFSLLNGEILTRRWLENS